MAKREKVFLVLAGLALLYGVLHFFLFSGPKKAPVMTEGNGGGQAAKPTKLVEDISMSLAKEAPGKNVNFIIARAEAAWRKDPFLEKKPVTSEKKADHKKPAPSAPETPFVYSGYLEMMGKKMCIINGLEYEPGEQLDPDGYVVRRIYPNKVIVEVKADGHEIVVPLQE